MSQRCIWDASMPVGSYYLVYKVYFYMDLLLVVLRYSTHVFDWHCSDNSRQYSAIGTMVRQLYIPFSVLSFKSSFYFSGMLSLRCSMIFLYVLSVSFLIYELIFLIASSSTVYYICWTVMRLVSSVVILRELLFSTSACSWKIGIANSPSLVGKDSNLRSSSWHMRPPVIAGMNRFRMVFWFGRNKFLILRMVRMK